MNYARLRRLNKFTEETVMALLINIGLPDWMSDEQLRDELAPLMPGVDIYCGIPDEVLEDVTVIAVADSVPDIWHKLPNLKLVQKLGAGVNLILEDPKLPEYVRVARLAPDIQCDEIAEYALAYVLREQRNMQFHEQNAEQKHWRAIGPKRTKNTTVCVLGLGNIGTKAAKLFVTLGFNVIGWSRSPKTIEGVDCRAGEDALKKILPVSDYVVSILPATRQTSDLFDAELFELMKPNSVLINAGRGELIIDEALIAALDQDKLAAAVLDVFREEPLPENHPFWTHPKITVTPHVSGWSIDGGLQDVAENYRRLMEDKPLLHEVDKKLGY